MKHILLALCAMLLVACDEQPVDWTTTLAIDSGERTTYRVVIIADVSDNAPVISVPDYATEVLIIREGDGYIRVHMTPESRDFGTTTHDTLRIPIR